MAEEILINISHKESRVAIVENGVLQEILIERQNKRGLVGNIYLGKVVRVLPGMQAAFVEMGLERAAFLHAQDMAGVTDVTQTEHDIENSIEVSEPKEDITNMLHEGQIIPVQVIKDPIGTKGARLTTQITIASRYLVYMPGLNHVGISQKIEDEAERERLKTILENISNKDGGFIARTACEGVTDKEITNNQEFLHKQWQSIQGRISKAQYGDIVYEDLPLHLRTLRDYLSANTEQIKIDSKAEYEEALKFVEKFIPKFKRKLSLYESERPIFDLYNIEDEIQKALQRKVQLKSGGYLIFDQTEAMTTIDVNTGAFVGRKTLEETIFKTNLEAASTIARQLRLRNLGGIIIVDFIDMIDEEHKRQVLRMLEKSLQKDHAKNSFSEFSDLGLIELTRKRTRESLEHTLCEPCSFCQARGFIKTAETVCNEIFREIIRFASLYDAKGYLILAEQAVIDRLLDEESQNLAQLESDLNKTIKLQVENLYLQEQFDVVLL